MATEAYAIVASTSATSALDGPEERGGGRRGHGQDHRVGVERSRAGRVTVTAQPPPGARFESLDRGAEADGPARVLDGPDQARDQRAHPRPRGQEHRFARRTGRGSDRRPEQQAAVAGQRVGELRGDGAEAQVVGVAGVDAADQRPDQAVQHLVAEA